MVLGAQVDRASFVFGFSSMIVALVVAILYLYSYWPEGHAGNIYIALHFLLTGAMLAIWTLPRVDLRKVLILGVILRIILIPVAPITSNDMERYLWDGAVALHGLDPYTIAPDNPLAQDLRAVWATPPEHAQYPTLYPPAALSIFALSAIAGPSLGLWVWKTIAALASILSLFLMRSVFRHYGKERHIAMIALSPLLLLEIGVGAHLDAILVLGLTLILYAYAKEKWVLLGLALGWSACVKFLPLALLAPLLFAVPFRNFMKLAASCITVIAFFYGGALLLGYEPIGILPTFFEKWRFTSPIYELLEYILGPDQVIFALAAFAVIGVGIAGFVARKSMISGFAVVLSVPLILSPVVFPWYLMILVPLVALQPNTTLLAWVSAVPLSYVVLNQWVAYRVWEPAHWPVFVIGCVLLASVAWDIGQRLQSSRRAQPDVFPNSAIAKL